MLIGTLDEYSEKNATPAQKVDGTRAAMGTGIEGSGSEIPDGASDLKLSDLKTVGFEKAFGRVSLVKNKTDTTIGQGQTYASKRWPNR